MLYLPEQSYASISFITIQQILLLIQTLFLVMELDPFMLTMLVVLVLNLGSWIAITTFTLLTVVQLKMQA